MRNVNEENQEEFLETFKSFILTMRNVNQGRVNNLEDYLTSFILTMRNVNMLNVLPTLAPYLNYEECKWLRNNRIIPNTFGFYLNYEECK